MDGVVNCVKLIMIIWLLGGVIYYVFNVFSGNSDIGSIVNDIVSVMMAALYPIGKEFIKLVFLTTLFSISLFIINGIIGLVGIGQIITLSGILMTVYYIIEQVAGQSGRCYFREVYHIYFISNGCSI